MTDSAMSVREEAMYLNVDEKAGYRFAHPRALLGFEVAWAWRVRREDLDRRIAAPVHVGTELDTGKK